MSISGPIVQYWHSEELPGEIAEPMTSFRDCNPELRHLVFNEASAESLIAEHLTSREVAAFRSCAVPAMQADYFRYCAVLALGGIYADAAFRCLRPLKTLVRPGDEGLLFRLEAPPRQFATGFFLFTAPGHPLLRLAVDVATENIDRRAANRVHMVTGPWVFHSLVVIHRLGSIEAARRHSVGTPHKRLADSVLRAVGDYERVTEALERVRVAPLDLAMDWIARPLEQPRYKLDGTHWTDWHKQGREIFR